MIKLSVLLAGEKPYRVPVRVKNNGWMGYGMGDSSGFGFGATFYIDRVPLFMYRQWTSSISETSTNYRDLRNLVEALKKHVRESKLRDCEVFLLTDNLVAENAFLKGSVASEALFSLVLGLLKLKLEGGTILHMIHIPGKRKIVSGVDALSRGDTIKGIIQGISILTYFPFHLVANQRSEALVPWLDLCWMGENSLPHLSAGG